MNDKELEKILNFILNNMGNKEMMRIVQLQETAQIYYLECEKLRTENVELKKKISDFESDWIKMRDIADKLHADNAKLRECVEHYADLFDDELGVKIESVARQVLKELERSNKEE